MQLRTLGSSAILLLIFIGCAPKPAVVRYAILRNVPERPSFVVIPAIRTDSQLKFADKVEVAILASGVKVVTRPGTKAVTETRGLNKSQSDSAAMNAAGTSVTENYTTFDVKADYIVSTDDQTKRIKIIQKDSDEILTSIVLLGPWDSDLESAVRGALKAIGIRVREERQ